MSFFESFERRLCLSASPTTAAVNAIHAQESAVLAAIKQLDRQGRSDQKAIASDLKRLSVVKTDASVSKAAARSALALLNLLTRTENTGAKTLNADVARLVADEARLAKAPSNATLVGKVATDNTLLTNHASAFEAQLAADADPTVVDTYLNNLATLNSGDVKTQGDISNGEANIASNLHGITTASQTLYGTDVEALRATFEA